MYLFHPSNPRRPVDWRWQRAVHLVRTNDSINKKIDDPPVKQAVKFYRTWEEAGEEGQPNLIFAYEALFIAHDLYSSADTLMKSELEARILSRQPLVEIAEQMQLSADAVKVYEQIFFNVLPKLDNPSYIVNQVLGRTVHHGITERNFELLWKFYGYTYGPLFLNSLITTVIDPQRPQEIASIEGTYISDGRTSLIRKQMLAAKTLPLNQFNVVEVLQAWLKTREVDRESSRDPAEESSLAANISALLNSVTVTVGRTGTPIGPHDCYKGSTELRAEEVRARRAGTVSDAQQQEFDELAKLTFPEPTNGDTAAEQGSS